ncbi:hypothetical protein GC173_06125 [bacterium]|nr:hypothetical protein [bacterium]
MATEKPAANRPRVEVLCLTYGEPATNGFAEQFEYSLNILNRLTRRVAPIPAFVTPLLAARRARARSAMFNEMGYSSPLDGISERQARLIGEKLAALDPSRDYHARMVMEFRPPLLPRIMDEIRASKPDEIVVLPLYMAESDFTTGISRTDFASYHRATRGKHGLPGPVYVGGFGFDERMGKLLADFIVDYCEKNGWDAAKRRKSALMLGAHGTLVYPPEGINSGARETLFLFGLIRKHLKQEFGTIRVAWLNHTLGGKWTFPSAEESAEECQQGGFRDVVYFPFGFMGDNNESQNEGRLALANFEWDGVLYLPCPNDDERFCALLAEMTVEHLDRGKREVWDQIEMGGRRDLIRQPQPAVRGTPGPLRFNSMTLGALSLSFWGLIGTMLVVRGALAARQIEDPVALGAGIFVALLIGYFKGTAIFGKIVPKNLQRLRTLPQPSPISRTFSRTGYKVILIMMVFGIMVGVGLKLAGFMAAYMAIIGGVGLAMWVGVAMGIRHFHLAKPVRILDPGENSGPAGARGGWDNPVATETSK